MFGKHKKTFITFWSIASICVIVGIIGASTDAIPLAIITFIPAIFLFVYPLLKAYDEKMKEEIKREKEKPVDEIDRVKLIGTRAGEQTKVFATYNFTIYSFLVIYKSGKREVMECTQDEERFQSLIALADIDDK